MLCDSDVICHVNGALSLSLCHGCDVLWHGSSALYRVHDVIWVVCGDLCHHYVIGVPYHVNNVLCRVCACACACAWVLVRACVCVCVCARACVRVRVNFSVMRCMYPAMYSSQ